MYTANFNSDNIYKISADGTSTGQYGGIHGWNPVAIAIDSSDNVYTAYFNSNSVTRLPIQKSWLTGTRPRGIAIDSSGNVYTANNSDNSVTKISADGTSTAQFGGTTGARPLAIAIDSSGNVYTANNRDNSVTKITVC